VRRVFVDTSAWFELVIPETPAHAEMTRLMRATDSKFVTSTYVVAELIGLLLKRRGYAIASSAAAHIRSAREVRLEHPDAAEEARAWQLFLDRADKTYSLTDCLSFVIMRRLGIAEALAIDDHFRQEGFIVLL
jgi:predicted nucleic acid-binding protein